MQQIGYSLIDAEGSEIASYAGEVPPNAITLPNGDHVHCPIVGEQYGDWWLVERWLDDNPPGPLYAVTGQTIAFDGSKIIVTNVYEDTPSLQPPPPKDPVQDEVLYDHENRIRAIEGVPPLTIGEFQAKMRR